MKKKLSSLIYKKLDNNISDKELKLLNKYLEKDSKLKEEYNLTKNILAEFKNSTDIDLPDNFKSELRTKLINYNLSRKDTLKRCFKLSGIMATSVALVCIMIFAFNNSLIKSIVSNNETNIQYNQDISNENQVNNPYLRTLTKENDSGQGILNDISPIPCEDGSDIVIKVNSAPQITKDLNFITRYNNTFIISVTELEKTKELLKDYNYTIIYDEEKAKDNGYFYLIFLE